MRPGKSLSARDQPMLACAEVKRDGAALDAILDDRFLFTYGGEAPLDKATVIKSVLANDNPLPSTPSEQHVTCLIERSGRPLPTMRAKRWVSG